MRSGRNYRKPKENIANGTTSKLLFSKIWLAAGRYGTWQENMVHDRKIWQVVGREGGI